MTDVKSTCAVRVEVSDPSDGGVTWLGSRVVVTPEGTPETVRSTNSLKPFKEVIVMVEMPYSP